MASVPITVLLYNGPLLCGFNVPIKELTAIFQGNLGQPVLGHTDFLSPLHDF